ncbi:UNVERIFIED_CONTAM: hypothetical protein FKN15_050504 [Acipenser sinensis]
MELRLDALHYGSGVEMFLQQNWEFHTSAQDQQSQQNKGQHDRLRGVQAPGTQRRRKRTIFSRGQLSELEKAFTLTQYPDINTKEALATITGLPESKIQVWFQNRRARYFKSKKQTAGTGGKERKVTAPNYSASEPEPACAPPPPPSHHSPTLPEPTWLTQGSYWRSVSPGQSVPGSPPQDDLAAGPVPTQFSLDVQPGFYGQFWVENSLFFQPQPKVESPDPAYWDRAFSQYVASQDYSGEVAGCSATVAAPQRSQAVVYARADQTVPMQQMHQQQQQQEENFIPPTNYPSEVFYDDLSLSDFGLF